VNAHPSFVHILNPYTVPPGTREFFIQQLTFSSLRNALLFTGTQPSVQLASAQFGEDRPTIPADFWLTEDLDRSILDFGEFAPPRKLPLLADILRRAYTEFETDYVIYSNADIAIQPHFYRALGTLLASAQASCTILRRTILHPYQSINQLPMMYLDPGEPHRGWDCFIIQRTLIPRLDLRWLCLGVPFVGLGLVANLFALDPDFREYRHLQLTFHLGNDRTWNGSSQDDYIRHNRQQLQKILTELETKYGPFPVSTPPGKFQRYHRTAWMGWLYDWITRQVYIPARYTRHKP
jgi:hypothetical protein